MKTMLMEKLFTFAAMLFAFLLSALVWLLMPLAPFLGVMLKRCGVAVLERWADDMQGMVALYAAENLKSTIVTNHDATPSDPSNARLWHGRTREAVAVIEAAGGDAGSTYRMVRLWSGWRVSQVLFASDDLGTNVGINVGIYQTAENGGAVVDADFFSTEVNASSAAVAMTDVTHGNASGFGIEDAEKPLWEALGLSADPQRWYDLTLVSVTTAGTGTMKVLVRYVDGT